MGAQAFYHTIDAEDAGKAFNALVDEAHYEKGHDSYNGTISTCSVGRCKLSFDKFSKSNIAKANKLIEKLDNGDKYVAHYIDLGVVGYQKTTVKKIKRAGDAKFKQQFCIIDNETGKMVDRFAHYSTKTEAKQNAEKWAEKGKWVSVVIEQVKISGNAVVEEFVPETKPCIKPKTPNASVKAIHRYIFFGWGAC